MLLPGAAITELAISEFTVVIVVGTAEVSDTAIEAAHYLTKSLEREVLNRLPDFLQVNSGQTLRVKGLSCLLWQAEVEVVC